MTRDTPRELFDKGLLDPAQYRKIDLITSGKLLSVFYELRTLLYLGVLLFTTGVGILIYQNIGQLGHIISIIALCVLTAICFWYVFRNGAGYSNSVVKGPTPYFDYVVLLGSLLFISVQGYLQFQFGLLDENLGISTLITALLFFYLAYRFDHVGILSLAITAFASFWSISLSPQKWYSGDFFEGSHLHITAIVFSTALAAVAITLDRRGIKEHFTFTYLNFCLLLFFAAAIAGLFIGPWGIYLLLIYLGCGFAYWIARRKQAFLFLLYAFLASYVGTTYLLAVTILSEAVQLWFTYSILSCGLFIYFIIRSRNQFSRKS